MVRACGFTSGALSTTHSQRPYQSHSEEHDLKDPPDVGGADDVAVPHRRHGHHEEIDTLPITQVMHIGKVWKVARVLKLKQENEKEEE